MRYIVEVECFPRSNEDEMIKIRDSVKLSMNLSVDELI
jgi:hypothetical protein